MVILVLSDDRYIPNKWHNHGQPCFLLLVLMSKCVFCRSHPPLSKEKDKLAHSYDLLSHNYTEMCFNYKSRISK